MKRTHLMTIGIILVILGGAALIWQEFSYSQRENLVEVGSVEISADTKKTVSLPPILGGIALACGVGLIVLGAKKS